MMSIVSIIFDNDAILLAPQSLAPSSVGCACHALVTAWMERPAGVEEWFQRLPQLLSVQGWEIASDRHGHGTSGTHEAAGTLSHCLCPWGGRLIKITLDGSSAIW